MNGEVEAILALFRHLIAGGLVLVGAGFVIVGALGVLRLPDFYTRLHAAGVTDTLGAELVIIGLMVESGFSLVTLKLGIVGLFLFLTSPTSTHAVANAAYKAGLKPLLSRYRPGRPGAQTGKSASEQTALGDDH